MSLYYVISYAPVSCPFQQTGRPSALKFEAKQATSGQVHPHYLMHVSRPVRLSDQQQSCHSSF